MIVDEFSALSMDADAANLFERVRSLGASVIVSGQSYAGLGSGADRILDAAAGLICHQSADPERLAARAGTRPSIERTIQVSTEAGPTGLGSLRQQDAFRVHPDKVRQLEVGECFVIAQGRATRVSVTPRLQADRAGSAALVQARAVVVGVGATPTGSEVAGGPRSDWVDPTGGRPCVCLSNSGGQRGGLVLGCWVATTQTAVDMALGDLGVNRSTPTEAPACRRPVGPSHGHHPFSLAEYRSSRQGAWLTVTSWRRWRIGWSSKPWLMGWPLTGRSGAAGPANRVGD